MRKIIILITLLSYQYSFSQPILFSRIDFDKKVGSVSFLKNNTILCSEKIKSTLSNPNIYTINVFNSQILNKTVCNRAVFRIDAYNNDFFIISNMRSAYSGFNYYLYSRKGEIIQDGNINTATSISFINDTLFAICHKKHMQVKTINNKLISTLSFDYKPLHAIISNNIEYVAVRSKRDIEVYSYKRKNQIYKIYGDSKKNYPIQIRFSADNKYLLILWTKINLKNAILNVHEIETGKLVNHLSLPERVSDFDINSNGKFIATTHFENVVKIWDISNLNIYVEEDNVAPVITIISPKINRGIKPLVIDNHFVIKGRVIDDSGVSKLLINGEKIIIDKFGNFNKEFSLSIGNNNFNVTAIDIKQNIAIKEFIIERKLYQQEITEVNKVTNNSISNVGEYYALIIGVQDYTDPSINDLDQPVFDAQSLYNVMVNKYTFSNRNMKFLKNPTKNEITDALDFYSTNLTKNDNLLIFYAGHGYWDKKFKQGYWLASDADRNRRGTWLSNGIIRDYMQGISAKHCLLITDACFGGGIFKSRDAFANASTAINQLYKLPSRKAMTSGALSEVPDKSVFIEYLVKRLKQNNDKYLSSEQLFANFKIAVINNSSNGQVPQFGEVKETGDEGGDFIFIRK